MDLHNDCHFLRLHVRGTHLHDYRRHCRTGSRVQRGHRDRERTESRAELALHEDAELVFSRDRHVLPVRRERHILLQAYHPGGQSATTVCDPSPLH